MRWIALPLLAASGGLIVITVPGAATSVTHDARSLAAVAAGGAPLAEVVPVGTPTDEAATRLRRPTSPIPLSVRSPLARQLTAPRSRLLLRGPLRRLRLRHRQFLEPQRT